MQNPLLMLPDQENVRQLFDRYINKTATPDEVRSLFNYIRQSEEPAALQEEIMQLFVQTDTAEKHEHVEWDAMFERIVAPATPVVSFAQRKKMPLWGRMIAAAVIILLLGGGAWWFMRAPSAKQKPDVATAPIDIAPGHDGAILTLGDGTQVVLDSMKNGVVADQTGAQIVLKDGKLEYKSLPKPVTTGQELTYNTMSTPRGRQFTLVLPDGSRVWLNSVSSITYPTAFTGKERRVSITGEVYFEVAHNARAPFHVNVNGLDVEDMGTSFNINAFANENSVKTTLIEGKVKLSSMINGQWAMLKPGEQAVLLRANSPFTIDHSPDLEQVLAWKNGFFNFNGARLEEVMRQLERWYDIEVVYEKGVPDITFKGELTKDLSLKDLLAGLEKLNIHFRVEGKKLTVLP